MSPSPGDHPNRTVPEWMDPKNIHGQLYYLVLRGRGGASFPKNPFVIGRTIEQHAGKIEGAFFEKKNNWYVLKIRSLDQVRKIATLKHLLDGTAIEIGRHPKLNIRKFVIRCSEVDEMSEEDLKKELASQDITEVRRITKKTSTGIVGTSTLILTINSSVVPEFIDFGLLRVRTRPYYPLPLLCRNCLLYGHPKSRCQNPKACNVCSGQHESENCPSKSKPFCQNCKGPHAPVSRDCPVWKKEEVILKLSTDSNISISSARRLAENKNALPTYARVTQNQPKQSTSSNTPQHKTLPEEKKPQQQTTQQKRVHQQPATIPQSAQQTNKLSDCTSPPRKKNVSSPAVTEKVLIEGNSSSSPPVASHPSSVNEVVSEERTNFNYDLRASTIAQQNRKQIPR
ncbi:uncharacterized protein LOC129753726 [Uranotaenia lowii]|uniref:uncharacterized protein LOC129752327 n=1 Tax=Uranotaenia lowii TaxID=190385 RepID=UPI002479C581|nr:uncharacterized protein LOC129752327 [Uranotaenia lowii]XP_055605471.1 uncharacterized protein LOC129753655 [Uranotaenia lowii]XP_055605545.1 uncharacterized protein LOC129753726 [Uranotaenia lowii]